MKNIWPIFLFCLIFSCQKNINDDTLPEIFSPNKNIRLNVSLTEEGGVAYSVFWKNQLLIDTSSMGFDFLDAAPIKDQITITDIEKSSFDEEWEMVVGEQAKVRNNYNRLLVSFQEEKTTQRIFQLEFKVYNDGLGFRYLFPEQQGMDSVIIMDENTEFKLTGDHTCWWQPGDWDIYEHLYNTSAFSKIDAISKRGAAVAQSYIPENAVNTPVTMKTKEGLYLSFHEANLSDYSGMTLKVDTTEMIMISELVGSEKAYKVKTKTPFQSPWRTIQIAEKAGDLIESKLIVNLNEPLQIENTEWIQAMKYVGIWWEMHIGKSTWDNKSGRHGANTENTKKYIDFAAQNGIQAVLAEGWNIGWEPDVPFDYVTPYDDFDLPGLIEYAAEKGVKLISHHETFSDVRGYEKQLDTAFSQLKKLGVHAVKTGYVTQIQPKGEYHHGQFMVNHYRKVIELAAANQVMVNAHEPIKPTGLRRTYPNIISQEGIRGQEFNAFSPILNPPEHTVIFPFTRMLAGPIDFTPGIFNLKFDEYKKENQVNTTLSKQLALYVIIYSPIQMAADLPEHYEGHPAFKFIEDVPVNWDITKVLNGEIGEFLTITRKEKGKDNWFLGSITDEQAREIKIKLDFLSEQKTYKAIIYQDAGNSHYDKNPTAFQIKEMDVNNGMTLNLKLAEGGGTAISFFSN